MEFAVLIPSPDPIPVPWMWIQGLLMATFVIYLLFMNAMLGTGIIALLHFMVCSRASIHSMLVSALFFSVAHALVASCWVWVQALAFITASVPKIRIRL